MRSLPLPGCDARSLTARPVSPPRSRTFASSGCSRTADPFPRASVRAASFRLLKQPHLHSTRPLRCRHPRSLARPPRQAEMAKSRVAAAGAPRTRRAARSATTQLGGGSTAAVEEGRRAGAPRVRAPTGVWRARARSGRGAMGRRRAREPGPTRRGGVVLWRQSGGSAVRRTREAARCAPKQVLGRRAGRKGARDRASASPRRWGGWLVE